MHKITSHPNNVSRFSRFTLHISGLVSPKWTGLWLCFLFLALPIIAFPELIGGGQTLYKTDLTWMHYPRHLFAATEWLAGRVPLWDPYEDTGIPLLAESQVGALYPFSVIFLSPFSPSLELSLFILLHFTLAALFTFILARSLGLGRPAATLAGLSFGCGGFLMAQTPNLNIMTGAAWLPLILYAVIQATRRRSWLIAMLAGLPLTLQILTAQPQIVFYTLVIVAGYGVYRLAADAVETKSKPALRPILLLTVTLVSGLLLAAPQLLPTFELQQLSVRAQERGLKFLTENSLPPAMWLNLILPGAFGNNVVGFKGGDPFQEVFIYIGFMPLLLIFWSWGQRWRRDAPFFGLLLVGAALLALGQYTPLYEYVIQYLPAFDLFRIPSRWLLGVNLALAILAGFGLETLLAKGLSRPTLTAMLIAILVMLSVLALIWLFQADLAAWSNHLPDETQRKLINALLNKSFHLDPLYQHRLWPGWLVGLSAPASLLTLNILITAALLTLYAARRINRRMFAALVILAVSLDLAAAGGTTINPTQPAAWWQQLSGGARYVLDNVAEARVFPLGMGSEKAAVSHLGQYFPAVYRVRSAGGHGSSLLLERYNTFLHESDPVQAIQALGVRYLLTQGPMGADVAATYPLAYSDADSFVYENKTPLPRAFVVHQAIQAGSPAEALAYFQARAIDPHHTVILEADTDTAPTLSSAPTSSPTSPAVIVAETSQSLKIKTRLTANGYLILLDTYYPGWTAALDGQAVPIYRANTISRAVFVPAGEHEVNFVYRPWSFYTGLGLALLMLTVLTLTAWAAPNAGAV